jgi:hypothetical protein
MPLSRRILPAALAVAILAAASASAQEASIGGTVGDESKAGPQKLASSGFGRPALSPDAIAELQIVTSQFNITEGRSVAVQVQAVSTSVTNAPAGSSYGFFRNDALNAADQVATQRRPYSDPPVASTARGPIIKGWMQYFGSYECEHRPTTIFWTPAALPGESFVSTSNAIQKSALVRSDRELPAKAAGPEAETATHQHYLTGSDTDLDQATRKPVLETMDVLIKDKRLTPATALSRCSIGVDFRSAEVDERTRVVGTISNSLFLPQ